MSRKKFFYNLKEYFTFSRSERNGILILISGIGLVLIVRNLLSMLYPTGTQIDISKFDREITLFEQSNDSARQTHERKYLHKDLSATSYKTVAYKSTKLLEINSADSASLLKLTGIGPVFAHRIIKYRDLLGGYYSVDQLMEVYGMKKETFMAIKKFIVIDTVKLTKLSLNSATFKEINKHPYISFEQTKKIIKYRKKNFILSSFQLTEMEVFTTNELIRIKPYLSYK